MKRYEHKAPGRESEVRAFTMRKPAKRATEIRWPKRLPLSSIAWISVAACTPHSRMGLYSFAIFDGYSPFDLFPGAFAAGYGGSEVEDEDVVFEERVREAECAVEVDAVFAEERS